MKRILVIRGGAIGDFILTLPALKMLRDVFPAAHFELLGYKHIVALAEMSGLAEGTRSIEYGPLASFFSRDGELPLELMQYFKSFQLIVSFLFDQDEVFAANLKRAGVSNLLAASPKLTGREHAARQLARPLERLGLHLEDPAAWLTPLGAAAMDSERLAIHPGSGSERKNWPVERFAEVAKWWLAPNENRKILVVGGEADDTRIATLLAVLSNDRLELAQNLPLPDLGARLRDCGLFLGHDSGISHLAAAVGTRALLLFGPTDPVIWAPANPQVRVLRPSCLTMAGIAVAQVKSALEDAGNWRRP